MTMKEDNEFIESINRPAVDFLDGTSLSEDELIYEPNKPVTIGYISDTHLDFYASNNARKIRKFARSLIHPDHIKIDILIIAGDIGHYNEDNMVFLDELSKWCRHKVVCVTGNHDYYLVGSQPSKYQRTSDHRFKEFKKMCNDHPKVELLDCEQIEVCGIRILGFNGWYDGMYTKTHLKRSDAEIEAIWRTFLNDSRLIMPSSLSYKTRHDLDMMKLASFKDPVDIVISHVNPSIKPEHQTTKYREEPMTGFFCFDGSELLKKFNPRYWFFGHSHGAKGYNIKDTKTVCNTLGYPGEMSWKSKIEVIKWKK